jgi:hypothetical protein
MANTCFCNCLLRVTKIRYFVFALLFLVASPSASLAAQPERPAVSTSRVATADELFRKGRDLMKAGAFAEARLKLEESLRLDPVVGTRLNVAECAEQMGQLAFALTQLRQALATLRPGDDRDAYTKRRIEALEARVPRLTLRGETAADVSVLLDGAPLAGAAFGVSLPLDPGEHAVVILTHGATIRTVRVTLAEGESKEIALDALARAPMPRVLPEEAAVAPSRTKRAVGWLVLGVGAAAVTTGAVAGLLAGEAKRDVEASCLGSVCRDQAGIDASERGRSYSVLSTIGLGAGLVGVGVGTFLVLTSGSIARPRVGVAPLDAGGMLSVGGSL